MPNKRALCLFATLWLGVGSLLYSANQAYMAGPAQPDRVLVTVEKFGGFAGIHEKFIIYEDGSVSNRAGTIRRIPVPQLQSMRQKIRALAFPKSWKTELPRRSFCSDCIEYRITFRRPSGKIVLHFDEMQMQAQDSASRLARSTLNLISGLKWK